MAVLGNKIKDANEIQSSIKRIAYQVYENLFQQHNAVKKPKAVRSRCLIEITEAEAKYAGFDCQKRASSFQGSRDMWQHTCSGSSSITRCRQISQEVEKYSQGSEKEVSEM